MRARGWERVGGGGEGGGGGENGELEGWANRVKTH